MIQFRTKYNKLLVKLAAHFPKLRKKTYIKHQQCVLITKHKYASETSTCGTITIRHFVSAKNGGVLS